MLLFGPPGTGKTLMARQIGKMLNGKDPKVISVVLDIPSRKVMITYRLIVLNLVVSLNQFLSRIFICIYTPKVFYCFVKIFAILIRLTLLQCSIN